METSSAPTNPVDAAPHGPAPVGADQILADPAMPATGTATPPGSSPVDTRIRELHALLGYGLDTGVGVGRSMGVTVADLAEGRAVYTLKPSHELANAMLTLHGGALATLMDTALGSSVFTRLPDATAYTTLELKLNFVRPVGLDDGELRCEANAVHVGRRTATAEARITDATGRLVAHGSCTCLVFPLA